MRERTGARTLRRATLLKFPRLLIEPRNETRKVSGRTAVVGDTSQLGNLLDYSTNGSQPIGFGPALDKRRQLGILML